MKWLNQLLDGRTEQERFTLIAGMALAVPLIIWLMIWQPLLSARENAQTRVDQRRSSYLWMQQAATQLQAAHGNVPASALSGSPQQQITRAAAALGVNVNRLEPQSAGRYSLWVASTDYTSAVQLVESLSVAGMTIFTVNMSLLDTPGIVSLRASVGSAG
jgi:general secretion pathway protein M